jgi:hypothetical protein
MKFSRSTCVPNRWKLWTEQNIIRGFSTYWLFPNYFNIAFAGFLCIQTRRFLLYTPYYESQFYSLISQTSEYEFPSHFWKVSHAKRLRRMVETVSNERFKYYPLDRLCMCKVMKLRSREGSGGWECNLVCLTVYYIYIVGLHRLATFQNW